MEFKHRTQLVPGGKLTRAIEGEGPELNPIPDIKPAAGLQTHF